MGPWLGWRPWRWVAGLSLGLCTSTKWSGLFFLAAFGIMSVWWDMGARRAAGVRRWGRGALFKDGPFAALAMVGTAVVVYVLSWSGWFLTSIGYHRQWDTFHPGEGPQWLPAVLRNWWKYHQDAYQFNTTLHTPHPYQSNPWSWLVQTRPTSFYYESPTRGVAGCTVDQCSQAINPIGTISVWWLGILALLVVLWWWLVRRDWRAGAIAAGFVGGYLPWFIYQDRTIYTFYAVAFEPWVVLAVVFLIGLWVGRREDDPDRWRWRWYVVGGYLAVHPGAVRVLPPRLRRRHHPVRALALADVVPQLDLSPAHRSRSHDTLIRRPCRQRVAGPRPDTPDAGAPVGAAGQPETRAIVIGPTTEKVSWSPGAPQRDTKSHRIADAASAAWHPRCGCRRPPAVVRGRRLAPRTPAPRSACRRG